MILLTGATGFIGSHLIGRDPGPVRFRCLVRPASISKLPSSPWVEAFTGDITDPSAVGAAMQGVDTVLHLAAMIRKEKPAAIYRINRDGTRLLVSKAKKQGIKRFIFVSTENALREDLKDAYADSKREAEIAVQTFENALILRPCFVYGPGDAHGLGRLVELIEKSPIVPLFGGLKSQIQPIYIGDMVEYLLRALLRSNLRGVYLLAGPEKINLNDFVKKVCFVKNARRIFVPVPYALLKLSAGLADTLPPSLGWGTNQLRNLYESRTYSIEKTAKDFGHYPRGVEEGLRLWFRPGG